MYILSLFEDEDSFYSASELIEKLSKKFGISNNYSRQLILRASTEKNIIKSSVPFSFKKGQYFYMHPSRSVTLETLTEISKKYRKPLYRLLILLKKNNGIISMYEAIKIAATPIVNHEKYKTISLNGDLKNLKELNFITIKTYVKTGEQFIIIKSEESNSDQLIRNHRDKMSEDTVFIVDIIRWLSSHGFIAGNPIYRRKENPSIGAVLNDYLFDIYSFSKTTGFFIGEPNKEENQTIMVADILLNRTYSDIDLHSFYDRVQSIRHSTKGRGSRKVIPIIFYMDIEDETKKQLNKLHILNFSMEDILGIKVRRILNNLQSLRKMIQDNYQLSEADSVKIISTIQESLHSIEESGQIDNLQNIKGDLFETLMFTVFTSMFIRANVEHSVFIKNPEEQKKQPYEFDLVIQGREEIIIVELKGFKNTTIINLGSKEQKNTVLWFFGKTYPIAKNYYFMNSSLEKRAIKGCYITSASFSEEALNKLEDFNGTSIKPNELDCYYDRKKLLKLLKEHKDLKEIRNTTGFVKTIEKYYLTEEKKNKK